MKTLALTAALGVAALLAGCNQKASTASPGAIDTPACCADKSKCPDATACGKKKAASCNKTKAASCNKTKAASGCPKAAAAKAKAAGTSPCCAGKKK
ncbi:MAG: hypothetical protein GY876_05795 [Planctomycetes bacterium]|jgi:hypothetical protein|nr:hypothetical protein [Planctomycetota bacterium]